MKKFTIVISILSSLLFVNQVIAVQVIKDAVIVFRHIDLNERTCTIIVNKYIPPSAATKKCHQSHFSWRCHDDDNYLWRMVLHNHGNKLPINIRYSSEKCFNQKSRNFQLLNLW